MSGPEQSVLIKGVRLYGAGDQVDDGQIAEIGAGLKAP